MVTLSIGDVLTLAGCLGGFAAVIYAAGKFAARLESLEEWRRSMPHEFDRIHEAIREVKNSIRGASV